MQEHRSTVKPSVIYGSQYDNIQIVVDNGPVLIVEAQDGKRYPVPAELVTLLNQTQIFELNKHAGIIRKLEAIKKPTPANLTAIKINQDKIYSILNTMNN